jgi:hypothetical protein
VALKYKPISDLRDRSLLQDCAYAGYLKTYPALHLILFFVFKPFLETHKYLQAGFNITPAGCRIDKDILSGFFQLKSIKIWSWLVE